VHTAARHQPRQQKGVTSNVTSPNGPSRRPWPTAYRALVDTTHPRSHRSAHALAGRADLQDGGVPSRRPPGGLPHGRPWAEPRKVGCGVRRGLPTSVRAVGLRQVDGMALGAQPSCVEKRAAVQPHPKPSRMTGATGKRDADRDANSGLHGRSAATGEPRRYPVVAGRDVVSARRLALHPSGRRFEPCRAHHCDVPGHRAQVVGVSKPAATDSGGRRP
jgi:hypothetical protein